MNVDRWYSLNRSNNQPHLPFGCPGPIGMQDPVQHSICALQNAVAGRHTAIAVKESCAIKAAAATVVANFILEWGRPWWSVKSKKPVPAASYRNSAVLTDRPLTVTMKFQLMLMPLMFNEYAMELNLDGRRVESQYISYKKLSIDSVGKTMIDIGCFSIMCYPVSQLS